MSEKTANLCTSDACESLRARLAKYEDAEGRPVVVGDSALREAVTPHVVEWVRCGLAANNRLVDGDHPALQKLRAALKAQPSGMVPAGWRIDREGDRIVVQGPYGGYAADRRGLSGIAESILYCLADALLTASAPTYRAYTTTPGEAVAGIALRQLGDESRWVEIRDLNAHAFPDIGPHDYYPVGTELRFPTHSAPSHGEQVRLSEPDFYWVEADEGSWNSPEEWAQDYYDYNGEKPESVSFSCAVELPKREYDSFEFDGNGNCISCRLVAAAPSAVSQEQG